MWRPEDNISSDFLGTSHHWLFCFVVLFVLLCLKTSSFTGLELTKHARLVSQKISLLLQLWDHSHAHHTQLFDIPKSRKWSRIFLSTNEWCFCVESHVVSFKGMFLTLLLNVPLWLLSSRLVFNLYVLLAGIALQVCYKLWEHLCTVCGWPNVGIDGGCMHGIWEFLQGMRKEVWMGLQERAPLPRLDNHWEWGGQRGTSQVSDYFHSPPDTSTMKGLKHTLLGNEWNHTENTHTRWGGQETMPILC